MVGEVGVSWPNFYIWTSQPDIFKVFCMFFIPRLGDGCQLFVFRVRNDEIIGKWSKILFEERVLIRANLPHSRGKLVHLSG